MRRVLSVLAAAFAVTAVVAAPAQASGNEVVEIRNVATGECLQNDLHHADLADCTGSAAQKWERVDGVFFRNLADGDCLDGSFEYLRRADCDGESDRLPLSLEPAADGTVKLKHGDRVAESGGTGIDVHMAYPADKPSQQWQVRVLDETAPPLPDTAGKVVRVKSVMLGECISMGATTGERVSRDVCRGTAEQTFQRVELGDGRFKLRSVVTGTCLGTTGEEFGEDRWRECSADPTQEWTLETDQLGAHAIRSALGGEGSYLVPTHPTGMMLFVKFPNDNWHKWEITLA